MDTNTIILFVGAIFIACLATFFLVRKKDTSKPDDKLMISNNQSNLPEIAFNLLPEEAEIDEKQLIEIVDKNLLARIDNVIPNTARTAQSLDAVKKVNEAIKEGGQFYQAIIPQGASLANSKAMTDAVRGIYHDAEGIAGHANFKLADGALVASTTANVTNAVMNVGSMVVGQYYMAEINSKLDDIDDSLDKISSFQNNEYKSRIMALSAEAKTISEFQMEVLENDEQRKRKLDKLENLEHTATELLGQANLALADFKHTTDFKEYEKQIKEADEWYRYQQILLEILYQIDNLKYVLNSGKVSREQCFSLLDKYGKLSEQTLEKLSKWHDATVKELKIDIQNSKRKKLGIEGVLASPIALFNEKFAYKKIDKKVVKMITKQSNSSTLNNNQDIDLYYEDVVLLQKNGKTYYLPKT